MNKNIAYGTLMGDAYFNKCQHRNKKNFSLSLHYTHSQHQKEYALYKAINIGTSFNFNERIRHDKRTNKDYTSIVISHRVDDEISKLYYEFYQNETKLITNKLLNNLTPESIAIQYCDDGNLFMSKECNHLTICTNGFDQASRKLIIEYFQSVYNIPFVETKSGSIRLTSIQKIELFMNIFGKYIPQCIQYKFTDHKSNPCILYPPNEELVKLIKKQSYEKVCLLFGVSHQTIRSRLTPEQQASIREFKK